jgi:hypothetical protein
MNCRLINEVRLIIAPWILMTLAALAPLTTLTLADKRADWPDAVAVLGFFGGAAILTSLSFRATQKTRRTDSAAVDTHKAWTDKMLAITIAVFSAGLVACLVQTTLGSIVWGDLKPDHVFEPILLLTIIVCSTGFWTLLARSVIGGILLTAAAQFVLYLLIVLLVTLVNRMAPDNAGKTDLAHDPKVHAVLASIVCVVGLSYAVIMLWLGRKRFASHVLAI